MSAGFFRWYLFALGVLALLSATVLDGVTMRFLMLPMVRFIERHSGGQAVPPPIRLMLERPRLRRAYHVAFAMIGLSMWWYLGTRPGSATR